MLVSKSPKRKTLTIVASQELKLFSFIVETLFMRVDLSFLKLGQGSKKVNWIRRVKKTILEFVGTKMT